MPEFYFWLLSLLVFTLLIFYIHWYQKTHRPRIPPDFLDSINLLLDQQHDKAIKSFVDLFEVNASTIEIHIILGGLLRQKGEFDKAIDIHQNIIDHYRSDNPYRLRAWLELAKDYYYAGLLGHAEEVLQRLVNNKDKNIAQKSCYYLLMLYETEKNWEKAINLGRKMLSTEKENKSYKRRITHYYCEVAQIALNKGNEPHCRRLITQAESFVKDNVRIALLRGDLEQLSGNSRKTREHYERAFRDYPRHAMIILPKLMGLLHNSSAKGVCSYIEQLNPRVKTSSYLLEYAHALIRAGREPEAENLLSGVLAKKKACMPLLGLILKNKLQHIDRDSREREFLSSVLSAINIDSAERCAYACLNCAFESHQHYWCCPSCRLWDSCVPADVVFSEEEAGASDKTRLV